MFRKPKSRLMVEPLENRNLLAGNVSAFVSDGNLFINGDGAANTISVESNGVNVIQVRGIGTNVNGSATVKNFNVTGSVNITMNGGADVVRVTNLVVSSDLNVRMGEGANEIYTGRPSAGDNVKFGSLPSGPLFVQGNTSILSGSGNDRLFQSDTHVQGTGTVRLDSGVDQIQMDRPAGSGANVEYGGFLNLIPGGHNDSVNITGLVVDDNMAISDPGGATTVSINSMDVHGTLTVTTQASIDSVTIQNTNVRNVLAVVSGGGDDDLSLSAIADHMDIVAGAGNDDVHVNQANVNLLTPKLGLGADELDILSSFLDTVDAFGSDGNDLFLVRNTRIIDALFNGEAGFDTFQDSAALPNNIGNLDLVSIERRQRL